MYIPSRSIDLGEKGRGLVDITYYDWDVNTGDDFWTYCLPSVHVVGEKETGKRSLYVGFS